MKQKKASLNAYERTDGRSQSVYVRDFPDQNTSAVSVKLPQPTRMLPINVVCERTSLSRTAVYDLRNPNHESHDPTWPAPVELSPRRVAYVESEIELWLNNKIAKGRNANLTASMKRKTLPEVGHAAS